MLGEIGTGKTALFRMLGGFSTPDSGSIRIDGEEVRLFSPRVSAAWGIGCAGGESPYVAGLSLAEHLVLGSEYAPSGKLSKRKVLEQAAGICEKYHIPFDIAQGMDEIGCGDWLWFEILRMLLQQKDILVLDAPDDIFTQQQMDRLISVLQNICKAGNSVLILSRRPETVINACGQVTVLRPALPAETFSSAEIHAEDLYRIMDVEKDDWPIGKKEVSLGSIVLEARRLTVRGENDEKDPAHELSFEVRGGEILCLLGSIDYPWDVLAASLIGSKKQADGRIRLLGKDISHAPCGERIRAGIACLPKNIRENGFIDDFTLEENLALPQYRTFQESGWIKHRQRKKDTERILRASGASDLMALDSLPEETDDEALRLILLTRELERRPILLIVEAPACCAASKTAAFIREKLLSVRADHRAVLLMTSQPEEAMRLADRILVLHDGEIMGEFDPKYTSVRELGWYMGGQWRQQRYGGGAVEEEEDE
ncbi:MAG: ATP-binding cassette domain-containing protein [Clostridia bacterium]|nr:ATP-binding cassette domain-containing protein [Clostridia bacterium]